MISINEKMFVTKDVNKVIVKFAEEVVLKRLLNKISFYVDGDKKEVSNLIQDIKYCYGDLDPITDSKVHVTICDFLDSLTSEEATALYYWVIEMNYCHFLREFEFNQIDVVEDKSNSNAKFGRELAYKLYEPEESGLEEELVTHLKNYIITFANEFDFSEVNDYTIQEIEEYINL